MKQTKIPIIILHGWAITMTGDRYKEAKQLLEKDGWTVYAPDLPGFGKEALRGEGMSLDDYVQFVLDFMKKKSIPQALFIGHSFGGRIAAKLAAMHPNKVAKLVICSSPLIKQRLSAKKQLLSVVAKIGKHSLTVFPTSLQQVARKLLYASINEWDYYKADALRETFLRIINEDLLPVLGGISAKTLIIWGENDTFVPLSQGRAIAAQIPGAILVTVPNSGHKLPYEQPRAFVDAMRSFLKA